VALSDAEEALVGRYLRGEAAEEERSRVDERFFADDGYFEEVCALDDELVNDYACDRLSKEERTRFEERLTTSTELQESLRFTTRLARAVQNTTGQQALVQTAADTLPHPQVPAAGLRAPRPWAVYVQLAGTAAAVLIVGWVLVQRGRLETQVRELQGDRVRLDTSGQALAAALQTERARRDDLERQLNATEESVAALGRRLSTAPAAVPVVAFILSPGRQRGDRTEVAVPSLAVPANADVRLQLDVPYGDARAGHRATLRVADADTIVWSEELPRGVAGGAGLSLVLSVPARVLAPASYDLRLSARNGAGQLEEVASYTFRIVRP
jgi:hypothetical protein